MFTTAGPTASASWLKLAGTIDGSTEGEAPDDDAQPAPDPPTTVSNAGINTTCNATTAYLLNDRFCPKSIFSHPPLALDRCTPILLRLASMRVPDARFGCWRHDLDSHIHATLDNKPGPPLCQSRHCRSSVDLRNDMSEKSPTRPCLNEFLKPKGKKQFFPYLTFQTCYFIFADTMG
jgi:hypothetical protein